MIDEKYPRAEEEALSERSEEESLCDSDSLRDFVKSNEEDMPEATHAAQSSTEMGCLLLPVQRVVTETQRRKNTNQACNEDKKNLLDTEMGDAIDNSGERSISASVHDMNDTEWLKKTNVAEMLACEASNDTASMDQWSDLDSVDEGKGGEKLDTQRRTKTSQVSNYQLVELKRDVLNNTRLYVSSDKPIGVPNFNHSFCYIASALQMLRDHTHDILSSPHEFQVSTCDRVMGRSRVITNMHILFKGVIACLHLNNGAAFVQILEAFFDATELEKGNKDVTEF